MKKIHTDVRMYKLDSGNVADLNTLELHVDTHDAPDFCDSYIINCKDVEGNNLTESDLDDLNSDTDLVYTEILAYLY